MTVAGPNRSLVVRAGAGAVMVTAGAATYPTGVFTQGTQAVPVALIVTGLFTVASTILDHLWARAQKTDMTTPSLPPPAGTQAPAPALPPVASGQSELFTNGGMVAIGAFITAMGTVLGLITAFGDDVGRVLDSVRLGAIALVGGVVVGLTLLVLLAGGVHGPATARLVSWLVVPLTLCATFGITCIGLTVYYR